MKPSKVPTGNLLTSQNIWHAACTYMQGTTHKGAWHCRFELTSVDNGRVPNPLVSCQTKFRGRQMVTIPMFNCRNVLLGRFPPTKDHSRLLNSCIVLMSDIFEPYATRQLQQISFKMATHIHQAHLAFPGSALGCKHGEPTQGTKAATAGS